MKPFFCARQGNNTNRPLAIGAKAEFEGGGRGVY